MVKVLAEHNKWLGEGRVNTTGIKQAQKPSSTG